MNGSGTGVALDVVYCRDDLCHDIAMPKASQAKGFNLKVKFYREKDGRWLADIPELPGATAYGRTRQKAMRAAEDLALRLIADRGSGWPDVLFACHERVTLGPVARKVMAEKSGLKPKDLRSQKKLE